MLSSSLSPGFSNDTEILTVCGWKSFSQLKTDDLVAQVSVPALQISFTPLVDLISRHFVGELIHYQKIDGAIDLLITPYHELITFNMTSKKYFRTMAKDLKIHSRTKLPTAVRAPAHQGNELTDYQRFLIALQADGSLDYTGRYSGKHSGHCPVTFTLTKIRKKLRLNDLLTRCKFDFFKNVSNDCAHHEKVKYRIKIPSDRLMTKSFDDWNIDYSKISNHFAKDFLAEMVEWDGYRIIENDGSLSQRVGYGTIVEHNADFVQLIGMFDGRRSKITRTPDNRKESYKDYYRLSIVPDQHWTSAGYMNTMWQPYCGNVYRAITSGGTVIIRRNKVICATYC